MTFSFDEDESEGPEQQSETMDEDDEETNLENNEQVVLLPKIPRVIVKCVGTGFKNIGRKTF